jgi:transcription-repair coupling factor (superfamily II helicase)
MEAFWRDVSSRYRLIGGIPERPLLPPASVFLPAEAFHVAANASSRVPSPSTGLAAEPLPPLAVDRRAQDPLAAFKRFLDAGGLRVLVAAESPGRRETMLAYFAEYGLKPEPVEDFAAWSATRWCTRSTASAATRAWWHSTSATARPSSCTC